MKGTINRVADGHLDARCEVKGPRELADLAEVLNEMLDSIEDAQLEIAERRRSEARLKNRLDEARKLLFLGQMAGSLAHEIGAPLATIDGKAQQGMRHHENPQRAQRYFQGIRDEVRDIEVFIRQLLSFGQQSMKPGEPTSLARLVRESWQQACDALNEKDRPLKLSNGEQDLMVRANAFRMGLALKNLFQNALQSSPETEVRTSWKNHEDCWELTIEDNGPGIDPDRRKDIFKPFISSNRTSSNLGLGLSLVKMVVLEHDGDIELSESPEGGAAFHIRFPHQPGKPFEAVNEIQNAPF
jgi:signal transduction histidine kinase